MIFIFVYIILFLIHKFSAIWSFTHAGDFEFIWLIRIKQVVITANNKITSTTISKCRCTPKTPHTEREVYTLARHQQIHST